MGESGGREEEERLEDMPPPAVRGLGSAASALLVAGSGTLLIVSAATGVGTKAVRWHRVTPDTCLTGVNCHG